MRPRSMALAAFLLSLLSFFFASCASKEAAVAVDPRSIPDSVEWISFLFFEDDRLIEATGLRERPAGEAAVLELASDTLDRSSTVRFAGFSRAQLSPELLPDAGTLATDALELAREGAVPLPRPVWSAAANGGGDFGLLDTTGEPPVLTAPWLHDCYVSYRTPVLEVRCPSGVHCDGPSIDPGAASIDAASGCLFTGLAPALQTAASSALAVCERVIEPLRLVFPPEGSSTDSLSIFTVAAAGPDVRSLSINGFPAESDDCHLSWRANVELGEGRNALAFDGEAAGSVVRADRLSRPKSIVFDAPRDRFVVSDHAGIRTIDAQTGAVVRLYDDALSSEDGFHPQGLVIDASVDGLFATPNGIYRSHLLGTMTKPELKLRFNAEGTFNSTHLAFTAAGTLIMLYRGRDDTPGVVYELIDPEFRRVSPAPSCSGRCIPWVGLAIDPLDPAGRALLMREDGQLDRVELQSGVTLDTIGCRGLGLIAARDVVIDHDRQRAVFVDQLSDGLIEIDLALGTCRFISSARAGVGAGPPLEEPYGVALDLARNRAVVTDELLNAAFTVDLDTGDRAVLTRFEAGTGAPFIAPVGVALDIAHHRAFVTDAATRSLIWVELGTGDRRVVLEGAALTGVGQLDYDATRDQLVVAAGESVLLVDPDDGATRVLTSSLHAAFGVQVTTDGASAFVGDGTRVMLVSLESGQMIEVSGPNVGGGEVLADAGALALSEATRSLFVADRGTNAVLRVSLAAGDRALFNPGPLRTVAVEKKGDIAVTLHDRGSGFVDRIVSKQPRYAFPIPPVRAGPHFDGAAAVALDVASVAYVVSDAVRVLVAVDLRTGDSTLVSR